MKTESVVLELRNVNKNYAAAGAGEISVLTNINLTVRDGESVAIIGPSGSGKSTLLNIIGTLDSPTSGKVILDGEDISQLTDEKLSTVRNRKIGFIFQLHHLLPQCTVLENVLVPALVAGNVADAGKRARVLLDRVGLSHRLTHRPGQLSGGECQRVAVVRALINKPRLVLADEPTGSLDRAGAENMGRLLKELNSEEKVTLIVVTHSLQLAQQMNRVYELGDGALKDKKTP